MSKVTNLILSIEALECPDDSILKTINEFFKDGLGFGPLIDGQSWTGLVGGEKNIESSIAIGAFNYVDLPGLIGHIRSISVSGAISIQLFAKGEDESLFQEVVRIDQGWE